MEPQTDPKLEKLSREYRIARDAWMELKPDFDKAKQKLEVAMTEAKLEHYETKDGYEVNMIGGEPKVRVAKRKDTPEG